MHLSYLQMEYLGCQDCPALAMHHPGADEGECCAPLPGCKKLLAMLPKDVLARMSSSLEA